MWFIIYRNVPAFPAKEIKVKRSQKSYTRKEWVQEYSERKNILFFSEVNCGQTCQEWLKFQDLASKKVTVDSATLFIRGVARPGFFGGENCIAYEDC